jgi:hypothetical protein
LAWAWSRQLLTLAFFSTVLYCVASPPSYQVLHVFKKAADGVLPIAGVRANSAGELFGTTAFGGADNFGSIFMLKSSDAGKTWSESIIFSFTGNDGRLPGSAIFINHEGELVGTTVRGGTANQGTLFSLNRLVNASEIWKEDVLANFTGSGTGDGSGPLGDLLFQADGTMLGTTAGGGAFNHGSIFQAVRSANGTAVTEKVLFSFNGNLEGGAPHDSIVTDGNGRLFGTATGGGQSNDGLVFQFTPSAGSSNQGTEAPIFVFNHANGGKPIGGLVVFEGSLFGVTFVGGKFNQGVIYELTPPTETKDTWTETILHSFTGGIDGGSPQSRLLPDGRGGFFGTASSGGISGAGNIFHFTPPTEAGGSWTLTPLHQFAGGDDGEAPSGDLLEFQDSIFGTTEGETNGGTVYRIAP